MATSVLLDDPRDRLFEGLYERYVRDVYKYVLTVLRNPADAEDVTQATFLNAYRAIRAGEEPRTPQNWLIAIAHNVCRSRTPDAPRPGRRAARPGRPRAAAIVAAVVRERRGGRRCDRYRRRSEGGGPAHRRRRRGRRRRRRLRRCRERTGEAPGDAAACDA